MKEQNYQICKRCIMDTTDPEIRFDENGICNHCKQYDKLAKERLFTGEVGKQKLNELVSEIKASGTNKEYDCVVGVSGGVDSTFVVYKLKELGLRPLAVHLDNGWNSELSTRNLEMALKKFNVDLYTYVIDWEEFRDLQLSFLKSGISNAEIPTDHGILAFLLHAAAQRNIKYVIRGNNHATEGILPVAWGHDAWDLKFLQSIHKKFGHIKLKTFPQISLWQRFYYTYVKKIELVSILDYLPYNKKEAIEILEKEIGWRPYGGKHCESIYTRFFQSYIIIKRFNFDKRKAHLSALICSGQITREQALEEMKRGPYPTEEAMKEDREYVIKKLGLTEEEFEKLMSLPRKTFRDYPSNYCLMKILRIIFRVLNKLKITTFIKKL